MASVEDQKLQRQYYETVREEFAREGPVTSLLQWLCRFLTYATPFGIRVNYSRRDGGPYQLGVYLTPKWIPWGFCLHHFFRGDQDAEYHNHPWGLGYALVLLHGYVEYFLPSWYVEGALRKGSVDRFLDTDDRLGLKRFFSPWHWNVLRNDKNEQSWHRLALYNCGPGGELLSLPLRPWTLFFHGRRVKDESDGGSSWGFFNADTLRYTGWRQFVNQPPSRREKDTDNEAGYAIDVEIDPDPTPMFGTALPGVPDTFDTDDCPTTPIPSEILKEACDASVCTGLPGEPEAGTGPADSKGAT